jgi:hypothetical protein
MNTNYQRVLPGDLFNEAKLLKCMGRLCLLIHDNMAPEGLTFDEVEENFQIAFLDSGALTITNLEIEVHGMRRWFQTTYNSKANYPLYVNFDDVETLVFDEAGEFTPEFIEFCKDQKSDRVAFWVKQFKPRTRQWQRATLKRLKADKQVFGSLQETEDKIKALKQILA